MDVPGVFVGEHDENYLKNAPEFLDIEHQGPVVETVENVLESSLGQSYIFI
jgi:hypothetical protein